MGVIGSRTTPHRINIKPNPTRAMIPRTTRHQDHYQPVKPLIKTNANTVGNCPGGQLSRYGCNYAGISFHLG